MDVSYLAAEEITRWLPVVASPFFVEDYYGNRLLYPSALPVTEQYRLLELAILRAHLRRLASTVVDESVVAKNQAKTTPPMALPGYLSVTESGIIIDTNISRYCYDGKEAIALCLDALEPSSTQFFLQSNHQVNPIYLGFALCIEGELGLLSERHFSFTITSRAGKQVQLKVAPDDIVWCTVPNQEEVIVSYSFAKAKLLGEHKGSITIPWSNTGFVIDTRGRPFKLPEDSVVGKAKLLHWQSAVSRIQLLPI